MQPLEPTTLEEVRAAAERIHGVALRTPLPPLLSFPVYLQTHVETPVTNASDHPSST